MWLSMLVLLALLLRVLEQRLFVGRLVVDSVSIVFCFSLRCGKGFHCCCGCRCWFCWRCCCMGAAMGPFGWLVFDFVGVGYVAVCGAARGSMLWLSVLVLLALLYLPESSSTLELLEQT
jgi:hypothetical protein